MGRADVRKQDQSREVGECSVQASQEQSRAGGGVTRRVLVTGGSGFVARALFSLKPAGLEYVAASRQLVELGEVPWRRSPDLGPTADWRQALEGVDMVIHLAGRVHLAADADPAPYFIENRDGTIKLARDASDAGIGRFLFVSSAKVLGDESGASPLDEQAVARPADNYAASKLAAERALVALGGRMKITILRPPLVYGAGVKANFLALLAAVARGAPLPLASVENRRSLIYVDNLAAAILACLESSVAAGRTYHVTDGAPVSTPDLVRAIAAALERPARLFAFPPRILEACGTVLGRGDTVKRLTRSLELDDTAIRTELGWRAPCSFDAGIAATVRWYQSMSEEAG
ncbi:MAG: NAD-dependent epimerase/dehydratase family protein [Betaproteobacteria bacterium]|nr:NAD-dependent epimerase/dehydratase family protein [Betaproteobacteria bacterium]